MEMELFVQWWQGMPALLLWENVFFRLPATLTSPLKGNSHRVPCIFLGPVGDPKTMAIFQGISGSDLLCLPLERWWSIARTNFINEISGCFEC